jgi:hypothetical protein
MASKPIAPAGDDTERMILDVAPEQESLDWICYRVRGGVDPADRGAVVKQAPDDQLRRRPEREDVERALVRLVSLGMLTCDGQRWSITSKANVGG